MWRPKIYEGQVSIRRQGNFFVIVCRNKKETAAMEKAVIESLSKSRKERSKVLAKIKKNVRMCLNKKSS